MIDALPLLLSDEGYQISRSVRLRSSASAYFNRTPASAGNRKIFTWSGWTKRGKLGAIQTLFGASTTSGSRFAWEITAGDALNIAFNDGTGWYEPMTSAVFRDPSAWYHVVIACDLTQATSSNRVKVYVNGTQQTLTGTYPPNFDSYVNSTASHQIGLYSSTYLDGYLTEINFIDGQALTPSSFGETNSVTGVWQPKKYTGTYGTNGFYLNFSDNSAATAAAIGADYSGNGNNWTPNNISVTAGVTYDSMLDVPTQWADGGNGRGNYCTLNRLAEYGTIGQMGCNNGNLISSPGGSTTNKGFLVTTGINVGMTAYAEATFTTTAADNNGGVAVTPQGNANPGDTATSMRWMDGAVIRTNNVGTSYGSTLTANDVVMMAVNYESATSCKIWIGKNGTWFASGDPATGANPSVTLNPAAVTMFIASYHFGNGAVSNWTFGQRPFAYTPPTGFKALNTLNLPTPTILKGNQYFDVKLFTGNFPTGQTVGGLAFAPDLAWFKSRSVAASSHNLIDSARGAFRLRSNNTDAESSATVTLTSDGFTVGSQSESNDGSMVTWAWKEGATQGFDIVTYTGTGSAATTVAHGLGVVPAMIITKARSGAGEWMVKHQSLPSGQNCILNQTLAASTSLSFSQGVIANLTSSTTFGFTAGSSGVDNANQSGVTYVAYLFAAVAGYSAFGSYTGNGSADGTFVYLGFRPRFVLFKRTDSTASWYIYDTSRNTFNTMNNWLSPNQSVAENTSTTWEIDIVSNGFKIRNSGAFSNANGGTYIYAAFCESPFKNSLAR